MDKTAIIEAKVRLFAELGSVHPGCLSLIELQVLRLLNTDTQCRRALEMAVEMDSQGG